MVSAKTGEGVDEAFYDMAELLYRKVSPDRPQRKLTVSLAPGNDSHFNPKSKNIETNDKKCDCQLL